MGSCTFHPGRNSTWLLPLSIRLCLHLHLATPPLHPTAKIFTSGCRHFTPDCRRFHSDVSHPELCCHHSTRMYHIRNFGRVTFHIFRMFHIRQTYPDGGRGRLNFHDQTYPNPPIALTRRISQQFCTVLRCSLEASQYVRQTSLDIFL